MSDLKLRSEGVVKPNRRDGLGLVGRLPGPESADGAKLLEVGVRIVMLDDICVVLVFEVAVARLRVSGLLLIAC